MKHLTTQQLSASLDGALFGVSLELVRRHLSICGPCTKRRDRMARVDASLVRLFEYEPGEEFFEDAATQLETEIETEVSRGPAPKNPGRNAPSFLPKLRIHTPRLEVLGMPGAPVAGGAAADAPFAESVPAEAAREFEGSAVIEVRSAGTHDPAAAEEPVDAEDSPVPEEPEAIAEEVELADAPHAREERVAPEAPVAANPGPTPWEETLAEVAAMANAQAAAAESEVPEVPAAAEQPATAAEPTAREHSVGAEEPDVAEAPAPSPPPEPMPPVVVPSLAAPAAPKAPRRAPVAPPPRSVPPAPIEELVPPTPDSLFLEPVGAELEFDPVPVNRDPAARARRKQARRPAPPPLPQREAGGKSFVRTALLVTLGLALFGLGAWFGPDATRELRGRIASFASLGAEPDPPLPQPASAVPQAPETTATATNVLPEPAAPAEAKPVETPVVVPEPAPPQVIETPAPAPVRTPAPVRAPAPVRPKRSPEPQPPVESRNPAPQYEPQTVRTTTVMLAPPRPSAPAQAAPAPSTPPASAAVPSASPATGSSVKPAPPTAPAAASPQPAKPAAPADGSENSEHWPLLCGAVVDESGAPVAGARVLLADLELGARTDRRGRFCLSAPPGDRTVSVLAQGFTTWRDVVSLSASVQTVDLKVTLRAAP